MASHSETVDTDSSTGLKPEEPSNASHGSETPKTPDVASEDGNLNKTTKALVLASVFLCMFLVALDRTIISTVCKPLLAPS
jgi:hypothetical protein